MVVDSRSSRSARALATRRVAPAVGAVLVLAGLALPFARIGTLARSGFGLAGALRTSGLAASGPAHLAAVALDVVPALTAVAVVLTGVATRSRAAALAAELTAAVVGALGLAAGIVVLLVPGLQPAPGAVLAAAAGAAAVLTPPFLHRSAIRPAPIGARPKGALRHG